ncbi:O-antigen polymerase [Croceibacterium sp. TMG7-5b_MA50]|uniref:O-antigen polymerase n=1 Tax=Croceibacterium sp. TMG7-5b_MA50 TaxID=3121290 RepID=UPI0032221942
MYEFMLAISVVLFLGIAVYYVRHRAASMFHPVTFYLMFHGLIFVVRPLFAWAYNFHVMYDVIGFQPDLWHKTTVLICTNLALVVFTFVGLHIGGDAPPFRQSVEEREHRADLLRGFWPWAAVIAALGLWAVITGLQFMSSGDLSQIREIDSRTGAGRLVGVSGYFLSLPLMLASLVAIIVYLGRFRAWTFAIFGIYALLKLGTGGRGQVVAAAVMIALFYLFDRRQKWPGMTIVLAALAGFFLFGQIGADRGAGIRTLIGLENTRQVQLRAHVEEKPLETMDLANMEFFEYLVWAVPERTGTHEYFVHNLQILTEPIPRALWPGKPVGPPIRMYDLYRYAQPLGATNSMPGTGWVAMGFAGVVIWSAFFAFLYCGAYRLFARSRAGNLAVVSYVVFVSTSVVVFRDGELMSILKGLQFYFVPVLALLGVAIYLGRQAGTYPQGAGALAGIAVDARTRRRRLAERNTLPSAGEPTSSAPDPNSPRARRLARAAGQS